MRRPKPKSKTTISGTALPERGQAYIDALGLDGALEVFLRFGGRLVYITANPGKESELAGVIGAGGVKALETQMGRGHATVPLAKGWCAVTLHRRGESNREIARLLHCSTEMVRLYVKNGAGAEPTDAAGPDAKSRQLSLFGD